MFENNQQNNAAYKRYDHCLLMMPCLRIYLYIDTGDSVSVVKCFRFVKNVLDVVVLMCVCFEHFCK